MKKKSAQLDMRSGNIHKSLLSFAIPLIFTNMLQLLYNAADVIVVGRFAGTEALSAVGSTGSIINLVLNLFMGLSVGTGVCVSKAFGARDQEEMEKVIHTSITIAVIAGVILSIVGIIVTKPVLQLMNTPDEVIGLAELYMKIFFCGTIFNLTYNFGAAIIRAVGDTRKPLKILAFSGLINVLLNLVFVIVFNMSVAGVALATIISQFISMTLIIRTLMKAKGGLHFEFKRMRICKEQLLVMIKIGLPAGIQSSMFSVSNALVQSSINYFGTITMAAAAASGSIEGFLFVGLNSLHQADITFASQNMGAKQYKRVRQGYWRCMSLVFVVAFIICTPVYIFAEQLLSLYNNDPEVVAMGIDRLRMFAGLYFLWGIMDVTVAQMRGIGSTYLPTIFSIIGICGLRVFWVMVVFERFKDLTMLYYSWPISWCFTFLMLAPFYFIALKRIPKENYPLNE